MHGNRCALHPRHRRCYSARAPSTCRDDIGPWFLHTTQTTEFSDFNPTPRRSGGTYSRSAPDMAQPSSAAPAPGLAHRKFHGCSSIREYEVMSKLGEGTFGYGTPQVRPTATCADDPIARSIRRVLAALVLSSRSRRFLCTTKRMAYVPRPPVTSATFDTQPSFRLLRSAKSSFSSCLATRMCSNWKRWLLNGQGVCKRV